MGEIDIIAAHQESLCFVEVKTRTNLRFGIPAESVTFSKQRTIRRLAEMWLIQKKMTNYAVRFDVIEVMNDGTLNNATINHIKNAF